MPGQHDHFLINRYGLLFDEVTASSLVKIDAEGKKVEPSDSVINSGGFAIPSTIHMARPEVACVLHTHSVAGCAISMQRDGGDPAKGCGGSGDCPTSPAARNVNSAPVGPRSVVDRVSPGDGSAS